jgi:hypothetical protein
MSDGLGLAVLAAGSSNLDLQGRRLLPLAAGLLLVYLVFQQLRVARPLAEARYTLGRRVAASVVGLGFPVLLLGLGAVIFSVQWPLLLRSSPAVASSSSSSQGSSSRHPSTPGVGGTSLLAPDPRAVTLDVKDLPTGYHVYKANPVVFTSGEDSYPSWDVVFEPDSTNASADYALAESLAIVYPSVAMANGAIQALAAVERTQQSLQYVPLAKLGDQEAVWVEKTSNRPELVVVRVTWRYSNVVGQVSVLAPAKAPRPERALQLAATQQERLKARAPVVHTLPNPRSTPV